MHHLRPRPRYRFSVVEELLHDDQEVQITKRRRVIARLLPPESKASPAPLPDFAARQRKIFGKKKLKVSGAELLAAERERF